MLCSNECNFSFRLGFSFRFPIQLLDHMVHIHASFDKFHNSKTSSSPGCWWHGKKRVHYFFWQVVIVFVGTHTHTLLSQGEKHHLKVKEILRFLPQLMRESRMSLGANFQVFVLVKLLTSTSTLRIHTWSFAFRKCSSSAVFGNISIAIN